MRLGVSQWKLCYTVTYMIENNRFSNLGHRMHITRRNVWLWVLGGAILVYAITGLVVARAMYTTLTPTKGIQTAAHAFPLPVARVDSSFIWMGHYLDRATYIDSYIKKTNTPDFTPQKTRDQVVDYLVETKLIELLARQQHVSVSQSDINSAYQAIVNKPGVNGEAEVTKVLKELYGMTPAEFKSLIGEQLLRERVDQQVFLHVTARQILVASQDQADQLVSQIQGGAKFEELVTQYSQDTTSRDKGGELGSVGRGSGLPKPVEDAIFSLSPDALPAVVKSDLGYHVIDTEARSGVIDANLNDWLAQQKQDRSITVFLRTELDWANKKKK